MNQPVKNADGATFQLAMLTASDGSQVQCVALVGADGSPITAWPLPTGAATEASLAAVLAKLPAAPALESGNLATLTSKDFATQTTLAAVLAKLSADPATQTTLAAIMAKLNTSLAVTGTFWQATQPISAAALPLPAGAASETTLAALLDALQAEDTPAASGSLGMPMLAMRADSDAATADDGDWTTPKLDEEGRLKVATKPASIANTVGDLAALNSAVFCNVSRASNVVFHLKNVGSATMVAGTFVFEASLDSTNGTDGTWFGVQAARSNANTAATSVAITSLAGGAGDAYAWEASVNGYKWFRVRCSVATTASSIGRWTLQPGTYATEPLPVNQVTTVTATANIGTYGGLVYTDSSANLAISAAFTGTSRDAGSTVGYGVFAANAYADQAGTLYLEKSTDNTTWRPARLVAVAAATPVELKMLITTRYNRVRYVNGAVAQTAFLLTSTMQRI